MLHGKRSLIVASAMLMVVSGCSVPANPASVQGLRQVVGNGELAGAQGLNEDHQNAIDDANAGLCRTGIWTQEECDTATETSADRWEELRAAPKTKPSYLGS